MDWNNIQNWLLETIWGVILLSAFGSALLLGVLNLIGRANKQINKLRIFYKGGNQKILERLNADSEYLNIIIFQTLK